MGGFGRYLEPETPFDCQQINHQEEPLSTAHVPASNQAASPRRVAARVALGLTTALMAVLILTGPSLGAAGNVVALQTGSPSPSGTAGPSKPAIAFLNPAASYDPGLPRPARPVDTSGNLTPDRPKVSDRFDGVDRAYHIVAAVSSVPPNPVVEAYIQYANQNEVTIGLLDRVGTSDTWEMYWDVPESFNKGNATMFVRLYTQTASGIEEVANHSVLVDMQHKGTAPPTPPDTQPQDETVEITWPTDAGQLGFYKAASGPWRTVIDGYASARTETVLAYYSVTPPGEEPEYVQCGEAPLYGTAEYDAAGDSLEDPQTGSDANAANHVPIPFQAPCNLVAADDARDVTAVALVTLETDEPLRQEARGSGDELTQDSADAHRVNPYIQDPATFQVEVDPNTSSGYTAVRRRTLAANACLAFLVTVTDHLDRPVQGANVDVHLTGPGDQVQFADDTTAADASGSFKAPDKGAHSEEGGKSCDGNGLRGLQGDHNLPGAADTKHRESAGGSGISGGGVASGVPPLAGQWRFHLYSTVAGITEITAWVDDEVMAADGKREADDDVLEPTEPSGTNFAQWYSSAPTVDIDPAGGTAVAGSCFKYTVKVRSGTAPVRDINADVHAQGPDDGLDFCDVADGSPRRAPERGPDDDSSPHESDQPDEATHVGASPRAQHTEGETNDSGNFVFGVSSPISGDTRITAWVDGETRFRGPRGDLRSDNDIQDGGEPAKSVAHSWASSAAEASVRWVNPSGYGGAGGSKVSNKPDANNTYHLNARVDAADLVAGVEFLFSGDSGSTFTKIGDAVRVGSTDTYELAWDTTALAAKSYVVRARIVGTEKFEDRTVALDNTHETVEMTRPANASQVAFTQNETTVSGVASAGAEKVNLFYTKLPARETHAAAGWIACGTVRLDGSGSQPQGFNATCKLVNPDQPASVTGIAAVSVDCHDDFGCAGDTPLGADTSDSGDAHRVFGFDGRPLLALEPAESQSQTGTCTEMTLRVFDQSGQAIGDTNVDVHLSGPTDDVRFCDVQGGSTRTNPGDGGHSAESEDPNSGSHPNTSGPRTLHTEGKTSNTGRFVFGVASPDVGDSQLTAWVDSTEDDTLATTEGRDDSTIHWVAGGGSGGNNSCTIEGTPGDDRLEGTPGVDVICGLGGDDVLIGKGGNDILRGQGGEDDLNGGSGKDKLVGGANNDVAQGGGSVDVVKGGAGDDILRGRSAGDLLIGYGGNDRLFGGGNNDRLRGGRGNDLLDGGNGRDACSGGSGANTVRRCE